MSDKSGIKLVRVYALANPSTLKAQERFIGTVLRSILRVHDRKRHVVRVSQSSGWLEYADIQALRQKEQPRPRLPDALGAKSVATQFYQALRKYFAPHSASQLPEPLKTIRMVPDFGDDQLVMVPRREKSYGDHWLYRMQPQLVTGLPDNKPAPVFGAALTTRVGDGGRIIHYHAQWRPTTNELCSPSPVLTPPQSHSHGHGSSHESHSTLPSQLVYLLEGNGIPQYYLSPYYLVNGGHALTFESACPYSLTVNIGRVQTRAGMSLIARVRGGSGNYNFTWGMYSLDSVLQNGFRKIRDSRTIKLRAEGSEEDCSIANISSDGAYVFIVNVRDRKTGAFRQHQQQIHSVPIIRSSKARLEV